MMLVTTLTDIEAHLATIEGSTTRAIQALAAVASPKDALRQMKFGRLGRHPIEDRALNVIEQVNQTFTYMVALNAARWLLDRHPEAGGFVLAPGAHASQRLDVMSVVPDLVGAETFAASHPDSNRKLRRDLERLSADRSQHRYAFFYSPGFTPGRQTKLERSPGVEVHCVEI